MSSVVPSVEAIDGDEEVDSDSPSPQHREHLVRNGVAPPSVAQRR